jgi:hypothetical protein
MLDGVSVMATDLLSDRNDVVAAAIEAKRHADEMRGEAIKQLLAQREQIDRDLKTLGYAANGHMPARLLAPEVPTNAPANRRFRDFTLATIGRMLLTEHGTLHGKEIERRAKAGGFTGGTKHFQNYMPVAFKRAGGFENIGGNTWKLNEEVPPQR